jgi:hypothetical protein
MEAAGNTVSEMVSQMLITRPRYHAKPYLVDEFRCGSIKLRPEISDA